MKYGDHLIFEGKSFRYIEPYDGRSGDPDCIVESEDEEIDVFDERWRYLHMHDNYFRLYSGDCRIISADSPETFVGLGI